MHIKKIYAFQKAMQVANQLFVKIVTYIALMNDKMINYVLQAFVLSNSNKKTLAQKLHTGYHLAQAPPRSR